MRSKVIFIIAMVAIAAMIVPALASCATDGTSTLSSNPIKETIEKTDSINAMRSQPAPCNTYVLDAMGNKVPTQTENSGKQCLGN